MENNMTAKLKSFILTALLFALVSGIRAQKDSNGDTAAKKPRGETAFKEKWYLSALEGEWYLLPAPDNDTAGRIPEIRFDTQQSRFSGTTGCNRVSGSFRITDSSLHFGDKMIMTRMFCPGVNETAFLQNLLRIDGYQFKKGWLILTRKGLEVSRWSRKKPQPKKPGTA
jgi:heat shock protein HslJ